MKRTQWLLIFIGIVTLGAFWSLRRHRAEMEIPSSAAVAISEESHNDSTFLNESPLETVSSNETNLANLPDPSAEMDSPTWIPAATDPQNESLYVSQMNFSRYQKAVGPPMRDKASVDAYNHGAHSKLTIRIVDESGKPVSEARVSAVHCRNWSFVKTQEFTTGPDGIIVLENARADQYRIGVSKQGYYGLFGEIHFFSGYNRCVENGRWIPWNPHVDLILKSVDNPIRLRDYDLSIHDDNLAIPLDTVIPFDLLAGDFLPPFGNGKKANAVIKVSGFTQEKEVYAKTELHFLHGGGVLKFPKDGFCDYKYPKRIESAAFDDVFVHEWHWTDNDGSIQIIDTDPTGRECVALRVPDVASDGTTTFRYGYLYSPPRTHVRKDGNGFSSFSVQYYLNPTPGDSNVEAPDQLKK